MYFHFGELPGFNDFSGYDPANKVTLVLWSNLTVAPDSRPTANVLLQKGGRSDLHVATAGTSVGAAHYAVAIESLARWTRSMSVALAGRRNGPLRLVDGRSAGRRNSDGHRYAQLRRARWFSPSSQQGGQRGDDGSVLSWTDIG